MAVPSYGLKGKVAFVTGGTSGINLGIAERLAAEGMLVAVLSRSQDKVDSAVKKLESAGGTAIGFAADVRDYDALEAAMAKTAEALGAIDTLIAGAAGNFLCPAEDLSPNGFKAVIDIDLLGTFFAARAAFAHLTKPGASILAISAGQSLVPIPNQIHANAAKAGVNMVIQTLANEWGVHGIRANVLIPGPIEGTEGIRRLVPDEAAKRHITASIPLGRFGETREVADLAAFLASDAAAYITGAVIPCDGGALLTRARLSPPKS
jgi:NAD(P)-dependent dehydrogenase (short-subunit alcohol dehydrogenase family)